MFSTTLDFSGSFGLKLFLWSGAFAAREKYAELLYRSRRQAHQPGIRFDMLHARHSLQRRGDSRRGTRKLQRALRVILQTERLRNESRQIPRHLTLQERRARDQRDVQIVCGLRHRALSSAHRLIPERERLGHLQVERKLHEPE